MQAEDGYFTRLLAVKRLCTCRGRGGWDLSFAPSSLSLAHDLRLCRHCSAVPGVPRFNIGNYSEWNEKLLLNDCANRNDLPEIGTAY